MSTRADELINEYLDRLEEELADFPSTRRRELVQEISAHIAEARASLENEDEASIRNLLDRMGDPADIAAEAAGPPAAEAPPPPSGENPGSGWDVAALVMLLVGGLILPVVGWFVGVVLLWTSETWSTRRKAARDTSRTGRPCSPARPPHASGPRRTVAAERSAGRSRARAGNGGGSGRSTVLVIALFVAPDRDVVYLARRIAARVAAPA